MSKVELAPDPVLENVAELRRLMYAWGAAVTDFAKHRVSDDVCKSAHARLAEAAIRALPGICDRIERDARTRRR